MPTIKATVQNGRIEPHVPLDLPEGTEVQITIPEANDELSSQAEIDHALAAMDRMEPLQMTDAELVAWEADRQTRREREKAHFFEQAEQLRGIWE